MSQLYFSKELYMFRTGLLSIIKSLNTVFTGIGICHTNYVDCLLVNSRARHLPNRTHDLRSGSQDHHPSINWVQKTICCNLTSNAPDDGRMRPKHVQLKKLQ